LSWFDDSTGGVLATHLRAGKAKANDVADLLSVLDDGVSQAPHTGSSRSTTRAMILHWCNARVWCVPILRVVRETTRNGANVYETVAG